MHDPGSRILMTTDAIGGVWQYATTLAAGLADHGVEVVLAVTGPGLDAAQQREAAALANVTTIDTGLPLDWLSDDASVAAAGAALADLARNQRADIVHLNSPTLAADCPFDVPVVAVAHGCVGTWWEAARTEPLDPRYHWHRERMRRGLIAADRVIAPSASYAETLRRYYALAATPDVVHNGRRIAVEIDAAPVQDFALTVGRLWDAVKNTATLDAVAERLAIPFKAAGAATGPHGETAMIDHLQPLGHVDADTLAKLLAARPPFVSAATFEPFGLAVLEAAGAGCPLILSDIPTFRELWDGVAIFVTPTDVAGFAAAIERCVGDVTERRRLGEAARARSHRYSAARMAEAMASVYAGLVPQKVAA
jgi:glycosyltransferase involved in cell wall biosynthesis